MQKDRKERFALNRDGLNKDEVFKKIVALVCTKLNLEVHSLFGTHRSTYGKHVTIRGDRPEPIVNARKIIVYVLTWLDAVPITGIACRLYPWTNKQSAKNTCRSIVKTLQDRMEVDSEFNEVVEDIKEEAIDLYNEMVINSQKPHEYVTGIKT